MTTPDDQRLEERAEDVKRRTMNKAAQKIQEVTPHRRQLTVGWNGHVDEDAFGDFVWDWLDKHGAIDLWMGCGPDEHPEDWEDAPAHPEEREAP